MSLSSRLAPALGLLLLATAAALPAAAGTIENLERERARLLALLMDPGLKPGDRQLQIEAGTRRLRDLERMALRDESLLGRNTPTVRAAFASYELTFLLHAAAEQGVAVPEHWLSQMGVSTASLLASRPGRR